MSYVLHYAPDNASLIVRMTLDALDVPFKTILVDRRVSEQKSAAYLTLNPAGRIPVLETPEGPIFETAAILLWITDRHAGLAPIAGHEDRGSFLAWLFFCSNTLHAHLRLLFYPDQLVGPDHVDTVQRGAARNIRHDLTLLDRAAGHVFGAEHIQMIDFYIAACLRWCALYGPSDRSWFRLDDYPKLAGVTARVDAHPATQRAQLAEGLGPTPFSAPCFPTPLEGSAL
ncbi:MAG: glutathione S-transferase family protein [Paracoccaceae bacterium]